MKSLAYFLTEISQKLLGEKYEVVLEDKYLNKNSLVEKAKQEWQAALSLFNNATDKELIDQAIFALNAAERRYVFLLKEARSEKEQEKKNKKEELGEKNHAKV